MIKYSLEVATIDDAIEMAPNMRKVDKDEITASCGLDHENVLIFSIKLSHHVFTLRANEEIICIFGTGQLSLLGNIGSPWLLGTDMITKHKRIFMKVTKRYVDKIKNHFNLLTNVVDARNKASIAWLKWLGFKFEDAELYGVAQIPFHRFSLRK